MDDGVDAFQRRRVDLPLANVPIDYVAHRLLATANQRPDADTVRPEGVRERASDETARSGDGHLHAPALGPSCPGGQGRVPPRPLETQKVDTSFYAAQELR